nr:hypothetical protein [Tanacetum cinerariifolium]
MHDLALFYLPLFPIELKILRLQIDAARYGECIMKE